MTKSGVKSSQVEGGLGKRSMDQRTAIRDNCPNDMEAHLQRLLKENDKLKKQLTESQDEASARLALFLRI